MTSRPHDRLGTALPWLVIVLLAVPVGGAVWVGFVDGDVPCILGWAQRTSMLLIALVGLFTLRFGLRARYLGMGVLLAAAGVFMSLRHAALHVARDVGQGFGPAIFGAHTYVWAWVVHWIVLGLIGVILLLRRDDAAAPEVRESGRAGGAAMALFLLMASANAVQAFMSTGPPPFLGQSDPVRLSFDPRHWIWSVGKLGGAVSWRGMWTIPAPDPEAADPDPARGPFAGLPSLSVRAWERIAVPLDGSLTDLARHAGSGRFLAVTDRQDVYVLDSTLARALHHVVLDPGFSTDLLPLAGAAFVGTDTLAVLSTNKAYVLLSPDSQPVTDREWRHFLKTDGTMTELRRSHFSTVRARQQYVLSLAYDARADELVTISVPSPRHRRLVVSRFAGRDLLLASEFEPRPARSLVASGPDRSWRSMW